MNSTTTHPRLRLLGVLVLAALCASMLALLATPANATSPPVFIDTSIEHQSIELQARAYIRGLVADDDLTQEDLRETPPPLFWETNASQRSEQSESQAWATLELDENGSGVLTAAAEIDATLDDGSATARASAIHKFIPRDDETSITLRVDEDSVYTNFGTAGAIYRLTSELGESTLHVLSPGESETIQLVANEQYTLTALVRAAMGDFQPDPIELAQLVEATLEWEFNASTEIDPTIYVTPAAVLPGESFTLTSEEPCNGSMIEVFLDEQRLDTWGWSYDHDATGDSLEIELNTSEGFPYGEFDHEIACLNSEGAALWAKSFVVEFGPLLVTTTELTITPDIAQPGDTVTLSSDQDCPNARIGVRVDGAAYPYEVAPLPSSPYAYDGPGNPLSATLSVKADADVGNYELTVVCFDDNGDDGLDSPELFTYDGVSFTVGEPAGIEPIVAEPDVGVAGESIVLTSPTGCPGNRVDPVQPSPFFGDWHTGDSTLAVARQIRDDVAVGEYEVVFECIASGVAGNEVLFAYPPFEFAVLETQSGSVIIDLPIAVPGDLVSASSERPCPGNRVDPVQPAPLQGAWYAGGEATPLQVSLPVAFGAEAGDYEVVLQCIASGVAGSEVLFEYEPFTITIADTDNPPLVVSPSVVDAGEVVTFTSQTPCRNDELVVYDRDFVRIFAGGTNGVQFTNFTPDALTTEFSLGVRADAPVGEYSITLRCDYAVNGQNYYLEFGPAILTVS